MSTAYSGSSVNELQQKGIPFSVFAALGKNGEGDQGDEDLLKLGPVQPDVTFQEAPHLIRSY
jgi:hypothetical protein